MEGKKYWVYCSNHVAHYIDEETLEAPCGTTVYKFKDSSGNLLDLDNKFFSVHQKSLTVCSTCLAKAPGVKRLGTDEESPGNEDRHYRGSVQPKDLINAQAIEGTIGPHEAIIIEYICRWRIKGGIEDLDKVEWWLKELKLIAQGILDRKGDPRV